MLTDKRLQASLTRKLAALEREIDCIGPTPLRQSLDTHLVAMKNLMRQFDQERWERDLTKE